MFVQLSFLNLLNATSSQALECGDTVCAKPDGQMIAQCGPDPARASLSARQAKEQGLLTSGTCGQRGITSSASAALQSSLESKLQARMASAGSTLFNLTWKQRTTPSGRSISALRASARRTSGNDFTSWPTPCQQDGPKGGPAQGVDRLPGSAALSSWPTLQSSDGSGGGQAKRATNPARSNDLMDFAMLAGGPTPMAGTPAQNGNNMAGNNDSSRKTVELASWGTPTVQDSRHATVSPSEMNRDPNNLRIQAYTAGPARLTAFGKLLTGSTAQMESGGQLNPAHSRWLMGLPPEWDDCGVTAMQSLPRSRRPSSKKP